MIFSASLVGALAVDARGLNVCTGAEGFGGVYTGVFCAGAYIVCD
jgi:hypothetical protein